MPHTHWVARQKKKARKKEIKNHGKKEIKNSGTPPSIRHLGKPLWGKERDCDDHAIRGIRSSHYIHCCFVGISTRLLRPRTTGEERQSHSRVCCCVASYICSWLQEAEEEDDDDDEEEVEELQHQYSASEEAAWRKRTGRWLGRAAPHAAAA